MLFGICVCPATWDTHQSKRKSYTIAGDFLIPACWMTCDTGFMTYPRSQIAPPDEPGFFHVVSRCVRRAFLCGDDEFSGKNFDHRRQWIEDRILLLAESFAVSVYSYAVAPTTQHGWFAEGKKAMRSVE